MRTLRNLCEGLLDNDFDSGMDDKLMAEVGDFIEVLKSSKYRNEYRGEYGYNLQDSQKLCDAAEKVAYSKKFKRIPYNEAKKMINSRESGTILSINWSERGSHEWRLIDAGEGYYARIGCLLKGEHPQAPYFSLKVGYLRPGYEHEGLGRGSTDPCYILPAGIYNYLEQAIK